MFDNSFTGVTQVGKRFEAFVNGEFLGAAYTHRGAEIMVEKKLGTYVDGRSKKRASANVVNFSESRFHINERFDFLEKAVKMVAEKVQPSVVISGAGGLGKTYTVRKALETSGLDDFSLIDTDDALGIDRSNSFVFIKGYSTPKALYRSLYANNNGIIVYDDCDSVLNNDTALNILKAALDSYDKRVISWNSEMRGDDDLPRTFEFTGQIIFITNQNQSDIDQAIRSRSLMIDVSMTLDETIDRMRVIAKDPNFLPEYSKDVKSDALDFLDSVKDRARGGLSLRSLITTCKIRATVDNDWQRMAEYSICE
jgi:hypothetical protein